ncbi:MAG: BatD family protein, partial [Deltaproteobacteria bacterium]|nr:BatD family protein [Deltaproteobacteria bacterium]
MKRALLLLCLAAAARAEERAFLETETSRDTYFVNEPFRLKLRIGVDRRFFETHAVQMFSRELDVPVQVQAPWLDELDGTVVRDDDARPGRRLSLALNDNVVEAHRGGDHLRDGRPYTVLEIERIYVATHPGKLEIAAPQLRFAHATEFKEDFVHGRMALDRRHALVKGQPLTLEIRALPEEGRPPEFTGAVGHRFTVHAEAAPRTLEAGTVLKLVLRIEGEGNLEFFDPPRLDGLAGRFHVYGRIDDKGAARRTITYDVAPLRAAVAEVPAIPFPYFDPRDPAGYRTVRTVPIPLTVQEGATGPAEPPPRKEAPRSVLPEVLAATLLAAAVAILLWRRARGRAAQDPGTAAAFRAH